MNPIPPSAPPTHPSRRGFLAAGLAAGVAAAVAADAEADDGAAPDSFDLAESSISDLQEGMKAGKYTARLLAEKYLARIETVDRKGPLLRSVIEVNPDAL